ncbi:hypothetical protein PTTG_02296 [Puccinia triticina 1-1 BBBD Race 1]|uniref:Uncharacterized protein n=2 Tax=Puccinia triticina TaxID=208348 RepID=A0A0C4ENF0_PUCT1|nr:uncharacterized protein PtA15_5A326 [Puccinia triticina]OAV96029.1 hypothetical protein PTTG_02296 [Puccinia triticina 1-1 BBBD Race 1]WAQ84753.1 hypothetical protein PtA15_5A326 [Puccinia triticina]WAR58096.1 hypothetical protein PtB15_5B328 [Puccinia triticina]
MKSIIKRIKRRASPTIASALLVPPVTTQTKHPTKRIATSSHQQGVENAPETYSTLTVDPSFQAPPDSLVSNSSRITQPDSQDQIRDGVTAGNSSHEVPENMDSFISFTDSSDTQSHASRVSINSEERLSSKLSHTEETHLDISTNGEVRNPSAREPSIRTFGDKPYPQNRSNPAQAVSDDALPRNTCREYHEERHTLKPVTRETIHKHVVEEVQKVKMHERHITYIQHHVQPIINPSSDIAFQDYRIELQNSAGPQGDRINVEDESELSAIIDGLIRNNKQKYETEGFQSFQTSQTIELPDVEHQAMVVHNYYIIQPVILKPNHDLKSAGLETKQTVLPSGLEAKNNPLEDTYALVSAST